jgi:hypothetical protein
MPKLRSQVASASEGIEEIADHVMHTDIEQMVADAGTIARRHPLVTIGVTVATGVIAGRLMRPSPTESSQKPKRRVSKKKAKPAKRLYGAEPTTRHRPMPKSIDGKLGLPMPFKQLAGDGARVTEAELALARAEVSAIVGGYLVGISVGTVCMAMAITTLIVLAQAGVVTLTPYMTIPAYTYLSVGLLFAESSIILAFTAGNTLSRRHQPVGPILKWLTGESSAR